MTPKGSLRLAAVLVAVIPSLSAADKEPVTPNVQDETGHVKWNHQEVSELQADLVQFEADTHIKIDIQYHVKSPPEAEDKNPGDYMRALSAKLGLIKHGILMVHFDDDPEWRIWIGDDLAAQFAGKPGTVKELTDSGAMHEAKEAMFKAAYKATDDGYALTQAPKPDLKDPYNNYTHMYLRIQTSALIDALRAKFAAP